MRHETLIVLGMLAWHAVLCVAAVALGSEPSPTLRALESMPVHVTDRDEPEEKRSRRLREIADAIDSATEDRLERAVLLTLVRYESGAAAYVHEGRCSDGPRGERECDHGRAVGHWQLHASERYPEIPDSIEEQARIAVTLWRGARSRCRGSVTDDIAGAFAAYGTGGKCAPVAWAQHRADYARRLAGRL